jgi:hypothetical protein
VREAGVKLLIASIRDSGFLKEESIYSIEITETNVLASYAADKALAQTELEKYGQLTPDEITDATKAYGIVDGSHR